MDLNLFGIIKARGIHSPEVQKIFRHHCEHGRVLEVLGVVAESLFDKGLLERSLPQPMGKKTKELLERVSDASHDLSTWYASRGVLCAKGYVTPAELSKRIQELWEASYVSFSRPQHPGPKLPDEESEAYNIRVSLAAQEIRDSLLEYVRDEKSLVVPISDLERVCVGAVRKAYKAFLDPDEVIHRRKHGDKA